MTDWEGVSLFLASYGTDLLPRNGSTSCWMEDINCGSLWRRSLSWGGVEQQLCPTSSHFSLLPIPPTHPVHATPHPSWKPHMLVPPSLQVFSLQLLAAQDAHGVFAFCQQTTNSDTATLCLYGSCLSSQEFFRPTGKHLSQRTSSCYFRNSIRDSFHSPHPSADTKTIPICTSYPNSNNNHYICSAIYTLTIHKNSVGWMTAPPLWLFHSLKPLMIVHACIQEIGPLGLYNIKTDGASNSLNMYQSHHIIFHQCAPASPFQLISSHRIRCFHQCPPLHLNSALFI